MDLHNMSPELKKVAFIGNHLPRQCGIGTFTTDLSDAFSARFPGVETIVVAMNDVEEGYPYPEKVRYEVMQDDLLAYERAANFLNQHMVDVISLQHEYGIFGGSSGRHILTLLRSVSAPVVTTLHTVLEQPTAEQRLVLKEIAQLSNRLVVMSQRSADMLKRIYKVPEDKIDLIPHGIHDVPFLDPGFHKDAFEAEGKTVILTFGLLSRNKGLEHVIEALPAVVERYPNLLYMVLGATHPHVIKHEGESYRESMQARVRELGLEDHVVFHNKFVDLEDLKKYIGAADIYITPYLNAAQAVSGTLAYTVGAGKAVISTPYWYAEEILDEGRGLIVPFNDSNAIAEKIIFILENEAERNAMRKRAYLFGRDMIWPTVAESYMNSFDRSRTQIASSKLFAIPVTGADEDQLLTAQPVKLDHLERLTDETGILQHAVYGVPNYNEGYTTDDNARALIVAVQLEEIKGLATDDTEKKSLARVRELGYRYLAFLWHAFNPEVSRFRNFMGYDRRWLEDIGSEDAHGRALWAMGVVLGQSKREGLQGAAARLFEAAIQATTQFTSPRAWAYTLFGTHHYLKHYPGDRAVSLVQSTLAQKLMQLYRNTATPDWPWFEEIVSYCNPALPQALLMYGQMANDQEATQIGLESLEWLVSVQQSEGGWVTPVGCLGFYCKGGEMSTYDQQPVEVYSLVSTCLEAYRVTGDLVWYERANRAYDWFFGRNALGLPVYDRITGGCRDGLHIDRLNENQGAESTLSLLQSMIEMQQIEVTNRTRQNGNGRNGKNGKNGKNTSGLPRSVSGQSKAN